MSASEVSMIQWERQTCTRMMAVQSHCPLFFSLLCPLPISPTLWKMEIFVVPVGDWFSIFLHEFQCQLSFLFSNMNEDIQ